MSKKQAVFIDSSFIKALFDPKNEFHQEAKEIWEKIKNEKIGLVASNFILDEVFTLIRKRCGLKTVEQIRRDLLETKTIRVIRVSIEDEANAWGWFLKDWSAKQSEKQCEKLKIGHDYEKEELHVVEGSPMFLCQTEVADKKEPNSMHSSFL